MIYFTALASLQTGLRDFILPAWPSHWKVSPGSYYPGLTCSRSTLLACYCLLDLVKTAPGLFSPRL